MPTKITKRGRARWRGRVQKNNESRDKLFNTKAEARAWEAAEQKKEWTTATVYLNLFEASNEYLDHVISRGSAEKTIEEKTRAFRRLFASGVIAPDLDPADLTAGKALKHLQGIAKGRTGSAANNDRKNLIAFWNWAGKFLDNFPSVNPWLQVDRFPGHEKPRYVPPENDFWKVYGSTEVQDRAILAVALYTAARRGEIWKLKVNDVDLDRRTIRFGTRKRKGGALQYNILPMVDALRSALLAWLRTRPLAHVNVFYCCHDEPLTRKRGQYGQPFQHRAKWLPGLCQAAGVEPFGMHSIRHLSASILYRDGVPTNIIQQVLRHKSPTTTNRYLHNLGLEETRDPLEQTFSGRGLVTNINSKKHPPKVATLGSKS